MSENNSKKYFKYAIGEIILVVIGILIALQINNWNQERITKEHKEVILNNLVVEFTSNKENLDQSLVRLNNVIQALDSLLVYMAKKEPTINQEDFETLLKNTFVTPSWTASSYVLAEMKASGELSNIRKNELTQLFFQWEREYNEMKVTEGNYNIYNQDYIEFITKYGSVRNLDAISKTIPGLQKSIIGTNKLDLLKSLEFENRAENFYFLAFLLEGKYQELRVLMEKIIKLSKEEIDV